MPAPEPKPLRTPFDTFAKMLLPEEGREEGGVKAAQEMLRTLLRVRFGEVDAAVDAALSVIRDLHRLRSLAALLVAARL